MVDYWLRPKLSYYALKRELAAITVSMKRSIISPSPAVQSGKEPSSDGPIETIELWASNLFQTTLAADVVVRAWDIRSGKSIHATMDMPACSPVTLPPYRSTELAKFRVPVLDHHHHDHQQQAPATVVVAYLFKRGEKKAKKITTTMARGVNWPEPLKHVHFTRPEHFQLALSEDKKTISMSAEVPMKGVVIKTEPQEILLTDNGFDVVPDEVFSVEVRGLELKHGDSHDKDGKGDVDKEMDEDSIGHLFKVRCLGGHNLSWKTL